MPTSELNRFLKATTERHPPSSRSKREVRILYGAQTGTAPPSFVLFTNVATELHFSYERFLVNQLRESFGFEGTGETFLRTSDMILGAFGVKADRLYFDSSAFTWFAVFYPGGEMKVMMLG